MFGNSLALSRYNRREVKMHAKALGLIMVSSALSESQVDSPELDQKTITAYILEGVKKVCIGML